MKDFKKFTIDASNCNKQVGELEALLRADLLKERESILPFFRKREHLSALIGSFNPYNTRCNLLAYELKKGEVGSNLYP